MLRNRVVETDYPHRRNRDGIWYSVCRKCYITVARGWIESELAETEKTHICNSSFLADRGSLSKSFQPNSVAQH
jgi:hypothetical protein